MVRIHSVYESHRGKETRITGGSPTVARLTELDAVLALEPAVMPSMGYRCHFETHYDTCMFREVREVGNVPHAILPGISGLINNVVRNSQGPSTWRLSETILAGAETGIRVFQSMHYRGHP